MPYLLAPKTLRVRWSGGLRLAAVLAFVAQACASGPEHPTKTKIPTPAPPTREDRGEDTPIPESLRRLSSEVDSLGTSPDDPDTAGLARALRALANALELTPGAPAGDQSPLKLREVAELFESSSTSSPEHTDMVQEALKTALQALVARDPPSGHEAEYRNATARLSRSINALEADRPLLEQRQNVATGFRAAANAVYLARGGALPFGQAETRLPAIVGSAEDELDEARADVLDLAGAKWTTARQATARALSSIADVVQVSSSGLEQRDRISEIRFQAERLRSTDSMPFGRAEWIKVGLTTALDVLDAQQDEPRVSLWTRAARHSVNSIEERASLAFQRAAVQDAFRSTVDALFVASQADRLCH